MRHASAAFAASILALTTVQLPTLGSVLPVDEARQEPGLAAVRDRVFAAAKARDARTVMSFASQRLKLGDSGDVDDRSRRRFGEILSRPEDEAWGGLEGALSLGGAFTKTRGAVEGRREFCAPYVYAAFPSDIVAEGTPWVILDKDVAVHAAPNRKSAVIGTLSYAIVQAPGNQRHDPLDYNTVWETIASDDKEAFVLASKIRDPEAYHVCFANEGGWVISAFTARARIYASSMAVREN